MKQLAVTTLSLLCCVNIFTQENGEQPVVTEAVYKTVGQAKLKLYIYRPIKHKNGENVPAIIFFHGGAWCEGHAWQFFPQCKYLAARGMVAISAEYRVRKRQKNTTPFDCVADAKSAIRWVRAHATEFWIDTSRIVAGGGSAGGHMAACTALINGFDEKTEDISISSVPNALVLFNPPLDIPEVLNRLPKNLQKILETSGREISPIHHVMEGAPPTIIFHGTDDSAVPFHQSIIFSEEMKKYNNRCQVEPFEGREHGFFNYYKGKNPDFQNTMNLTVKFLVSIGYLN
ncbi:MAG: alpha/beta hydrolase [Bacteroidales bacterium]